MEIYNLSIKNKAQNASYKHRKEYPHVEYAITFNRGEKLPKETHSGEIINFKQWK